MGATRLLLPMLVACVSGLCAPNAHAQDKLVLAHYLPWHQSKDFNGFWGGHWAGFMGEADPDTLAPDGLPDIWSNYDPLIGLYDNEDPDLIECHLLQMKLAGIDGVISLWFGTSGEFDFGFIDAANRALFEGCREFGMQFSVMYEDRTIFNLIDGGFIDPPTDANISAQFAQDLNWAEDNWFNEPHYTRFEGAPLLTNFGSLTVEEGVATPAAWDSAFASLDGPVSFFPLHSLFTQTPGVSDGGFMWVERSPFDGLPPEAVVRQRLTNRYNIYASDQQDLLASAVPGFDDVYAPDQTFPDLAYQNGATLRITLDHALEDGDWPIVQLVTWNDFGEGTMLEPTVQFGYTFLEIVQEAMAREKGPLFTFTPDDLRLPAQLYALRKSGMVDEQTLDLVSQRVNEGDVDEARNLLGAIAGDVVTTHPEAQIVEAGGTLVFTAQLAGGDAGVAFFWEKDGVPVANDARISGANTTTLTITSAGSADAGSYRLVANISGLLAPSEPAPGAVRPSDDELDVNGDGLVNFLDLIELLSVTGG
ncbi:MAG: immunoglobulin domain-containing protein [Planctomycetota bacterium]